MIQKMNITPKGNRLSGFKVGGTYGVTTTVVKGNVYVNPIVTTDQLSLGYVLKGSSDLVKHLQKNLWSVVNTHTTLGGVGEKPSGHQSSIFVNIEKSQIKPLESISNVCVTQEKHLRKSLGSVVIAEQTVVENPQHFWSADSVVKSLMGLTHSSVVGPYQSGAASHGVQKVFLANRESVLTFGHTMAWGVSKTESIYGLTAVSLIVRKILDGVASVRSRLVLDKQNYFSEDYFAEGYFGEKRYVG